VQVLVCPGVQELSATQAFVAALRSRLAPEDQLWCLGPEVLPYSSAHILAALSQRCDAQKPLLWLSYSAGVVGSLGAAWAWQAMGGTVTAFVALDGWGMPLGGAFPIHRLSHDDFTHWSSALLGTGSENFYADPPVSHADLWRSPAEVRGWQVTRVPGGETRSPTTALEFLVALRHRYEPGRSPGLPL